MKSKIDTISLSAIFNFVQLSISNLNYNAKYVIDNYDKNQDLIENSALSLSSSSSITIKDANINESPNGKSKQSRNPCNYFSNKMKAGSIEGSVFTIVISTVGAGCLSLLSK